MVVDFKTPISNLKRIIKQDSSSNFNIVVNFKNKSQKSDQIQYQTTVNKARIISSNINQLYHIDPTINEYIINMPPKFESSSKMNDSSQIAKILHLLVKSTDETIQISNEEHHFFTIMRFLLGEDEEGQFQFEIKNEEEALSFLTTEFHHKSIEYLSLHFIEFIEKGNFTSIDSDIMKDIIDSFFENHRKLEEEQEMKENEIKNEEEDEEEQIFSEEDKSIKEKEKKKLISIFHIMLNEEEETDVIMHFLLNLKTDEFSDEMIDFFYKELDDEIILKELPKVIFILRNHITDLIDIRNYQQNKPNQNKNKNNIECNFEGNEFNGIISYLKRTTNKNIYESGDLKITGGGTISASCPLHNIIKYDYDHINDYYFNSFKRAPNEGENWIEFDFCDRKINVTSYTLRTGSNQACEDAHPKSWRIVGSNDRENWKVVNKQIDNDVLNGKYKQHHFECKKRKEFYRYIRYIQDDSWFSKNEFKYKIKLTCIEFFGSVSRHNFLL